MGTMRSRSPEHQAAVKPRLLRHSALQRAACLGLTLLCAAIPAVSISNAAAGLAAKGAAEHVVLVVWDGMRPDFIDPRHTPALHALAQRGTFFTRHHPVYLSSTEVNGTALITGAYPEHSTIGANTDYRPEIDRLKPVATEAAATIRAGDLLASGHYIAVPTLTEIIQKAGFPTMVAGTKQVAILLDRFDQRITTASLASVDLHKGQTLPPSVLADLVRANGGLGFPTNISYPNVQQDRWTTTALVQGLWSTGVPKFSVLWLSDPDFSQHDSGPGSPRALAGLESSDRNLGTVIEELKRRGELDKTDVLVVSDHGFSTIERGVDVADLLKKAGFKAARKLENPQPGDVLVVGLGGSVSVYVIGHDEQVISRLAHFFQGSDFAGVVFSKAPRPGTFTLKQARVETPSAPDLLVSLRWSDQASAFGAPGLLVADEGKKGKGTHASLSAYDMHNTLVAAGPDFRPLFKDELPTGNADLAPTILWILGISVPHSMDGRVLVEALAGADVKVPKVKRRAIGATATGASYKWRQYLSISTVGEAVYFDEGNGVSTAR